MNTKMYNQLASKYSDYASKKRRYLDAIDDLIIMRTEMPTQKLLDVGAGDGRRAKKISGKLGINYVALMDNSEEMLAFGENLSSWNIIHESIEDYSDYPKGPWVLFSESDCVQL